ncbi:MAG: YicC/YloC family endoribonuclease [Lachnospiraceae bacterium]
MIYSMTGFGRYELTENNRKLTIEMKSVNHRYFDVNIKMPKKFGIFEADMRSFLKNYAKRGKIDIYVTYEDLSGADCNLKYNGALAEEYVKYYRKIKEDFGLKDDITISLVSKSPEVLSMEDDAIDEEEIWNLLKNTLEGACMKFAEARAAEGENLKNDLMGKLQDMTRQIERVEERSPQVLEEYRRKLEDKMQEIFDNTQIDDSRIASEVILFADKMCVDEEIVRLKSHVENMKEDLKNGGDIGRKLDFVAQEMNREANTILSKANDMEVTNIAIGLKTEIEKIREQIQNIE